MYVVRIFYCDAASLKWKLILCEIISTHLNEIAVYAIIPAHLFSRAVFLLLLFCLISFLRAMNLFTMCRYDSNAGRKIVTNEDDERRCVSEK